MTNNTVIKTQEDVVNALQSGNSLCYTDYSNLFERSIKLTIYTVPDLYNVGHFFYHIYNVDGNLIVSSRNALHALVMASGHIKDFDEDTFNYAHWQILHIFPME